MKEKLTVLIADDERLAREELVYLLSRERDVELLEPACSGREVIESARRHKPDAIFLDVEMPEMNGLQAAQTLREESLLPMIVFTTAYEHYAVKAFGVEAVDYLLKPYDEQRLGIALQRLRQRKVTKQAGLSSAGEQVSSDDTAEASGGEYAGTPSSEDGAVKQEPVFTDRDASAIFAGASEGDRPSAVTAGQMPSSRKVRLLVEDGGRMVVLDGSSLLFAMKEDKHTRIRMADGTEYSARQTLQELEERLGPDFFRPHRSYLINLDQVREIQPWFNGAYNAVMNHAEEIKIPVSRTAAKEMMRLLQEGS
ncbi:LytR/AlgR family response regulator transcription factor [Paenibacillus herberti]|uniref:DNA-binding response regulator n=1 Tax=Paenibacillus herberti TaxID=1619309 RepID=A0A229NU55_9BACL|nr:LytTR family DNA-binding domain-containing protein [Paenibacillus herberti]OXM13392.1 DNA-binding response regulator [Paenibacillus herberti]